MDAPTSRLLVNESVVAAGVGEESVLLNPETGRYIGLNRLGRYVWTLIEQGLTSEQVMQRVLAEYDVDEPRLREDVGRFLDDLQAKGLVRAPRE